MNPLKSVKIKVTAADIKNGIVADAESCAIGLALKRSYKPENVEVNTDRIELSFKNGTISVKPDKAICAFIRKFDADPESVKPQTFVLEL